MCTIRSHWPFYWPTYYLLVTHLIFLHMFTLPSISLIFPLEHSLTFYDLSIDYSLLSHSTDQHVYKPKCFLYFFFKLDLCNVSYSSLIPRSPQNSLSFCPTTKWTLSLVMDKLLTDFSLNLWTFELRLVFTPPSIQGKHNTATVESKVGSIQDKNGMEWKPLVWSTGGGLKIEERRKRLRQCSI